MARSLVAFVMLMALVGCQCAGRTSPECTQRLVAVQRSKLVELARLYGFRAPDLRGGVWSNSSGTRVILQELIGPRIGSLYVFKKGEHVPKVIRQDEQHYVALDDSGDIVASFDGEVWNNSHGQSLGVRELVLDRSGILYLGTGGLRYIAHPETLLLPSPDGFKIYQLETRNELIYLFGNEPAGEACQIWQLTRQGPRLIRKIAMPGSYQRKLDPRSDCVVLARESMPFLHVPFVFNLDSGERFELMDWSTHEYLFLENDWLHELMRVSGTE